MGILNLTNSLELAVDSTELSIDNVGNAVWDHILANGDAAGANLNRSANKIDSLYQDQNRPWSSIVTHTFQRGVSGGHYGYEYETHGLATHLIADFQHQGDFEIEDLYYDSNDDELVLKFMSDNTPEPEIQYFEGGRIRIAFFPIVTFETVFYLTAAKWTDSTKTFTFTPGDGIGDHINWLQNVPNFAVFTLQVLPRTEVDRDFDAATRALMETDAGQAWTDDQQTYIAAALGIPGITHNVPIGGLISDLHNTIVTQHLEAQSIAITVEQSGAQFGYDSGAGFGSVLPNNAFVVDGDTLNINRIFRDDESGHEVLIVRFQQMHY